MGESKVLEVLFPGPRRWILCALFGEPDRCWSASELAGRAGIQPGTVKQHLRQMRNCGLLRECDDAGRPRFQPDPTARVYGDVLAIVNKLTFAEERVETVLVVEDHPATAQVTRILLESWGYRVLEAHEGPEAIHIFKKAAGSIDLVLTDVIMPGMNGPQLADLLREIQPGLRVLFMSGYPSDELLDRNCAFLPKPFNPEGLSRAVRRELDRRVPAQRAH